MARFESAIENIKHLNGKTTDISVQAHWLVLFENNERPASKGGRADDSELVARMKAEFPQGKDYTEADIRMHRQLYISGRLIALRRRNERRGKDTAREIHRFENGKVVPNRVNFKVETKKTKKSAKKAKTVTRKAKTGKAKTARKSGTRIVSAAKLLGGSAAKQTGMEEAEQSNAA
jgi:hypothetical protein